MVTDRRCREAFYFVNLYGCKPLKINSHAQFRYLCFVHHYHCCWIFQAQATFQGNKDITDFTDGNTNLCFIYMPLKVYIQPRAVNGSEMASILSRPQCVNTLFSVVKCKIGEPAMPRSCISRLVCIEPPVCYLSPIEHNVILCIHHYCACFSFSGGLHASGQIWP